MTSRVTVNFNDDVGDWITEQVENGNFESKSQCVEAVFLTGRDEYPDLEDRVDELEERLEQRENRINELEDQLRRRSNIEDEIETVAETVEGLPARIENTESYSERRQRAMDQAGILTRAKWRVTGVPTEEIERE